MSDPPEATRALNAVVVAFLTGANRFVDALAENRYPPVTEEKLRGTADEVVRLQDEANERRASTQDMPRARRFASLARIRHPSPAQMPL